MSRGFDGVSRKATSASGVQGSITDKFTLACWFYRLSSGDKTIARNDNGGGDRGFGLFDSSGKLIGYCHNGSVRTITGSTTLSNNTWYHTASWYDGAALKVFLNGADDGSLSTSGNVTASSLSMVWASYGGGEFLNALLGECAIWDVALDAGEMASLARGYAPSVVRPASLVSYWPMIGRYSPEIDVISGNELTLTDSPTAENHPRVLYPHKLKGRRFTTAAGGGGGGFSSAFFRENAGLGAVGGGPFARANAGLGAVA